MKRFNQITIGIILLMSLLFIIVNLYLHYLQNDEKNRTYQVEINRLQREISENGFENINLEECNYIKKVEVLSEDTTKEEKIDFFAGENSDYSLRLLEGKYYRFDYISKFTEQYNKINVAVNISLVLMFIVILVILVYLRLRLMKPFHQIKDMPFELSKGNLTGGIKESKSRFFGKFVWGLNLLRENLEQQKEKELSLQKEKKILILSISHDIKTPLSAIKLYAQALSKNLYQTDEKKHEIADSISTKADEIEAFVDDIIHASSSDFLNIQVEEGEFYLEELIKQTKEYYSEKLALIKTKFQVERYENCLIKGDLDRTMEVIQNIIENAIKYGDGEYIHIAIDTEEDCKLLTITNSGTTLASNELTHIFDSFWRGSNVGNKSGSGLGLYICRQILRKMDGDIYAECKKSKMQVTVVLRMM